MNTFRIPTHALPVDIATFETALDAYIAARITHNKTVGVAAPFPAQEIYRVIYERLIAGNEVEIYDTGTPGQPIALLADNETFIAKGAPLVALYPSLK